MLTHCKEADSLQHGNSQHHKENLPVCSHIHGPLLIQFQRVIQPLHKPFFVPYDPKFMTDPSAKKCQIPHTVF